MILANVYPPRLWTVYPPRQRIVIVCRRRQALKIDWVAMLEAA